MKKGTKIPIAVVVTIIIFIFGLFGAGWSYRPIVDYYMSGISDDFTFANRFPMRVELNFRNRGSIDASLKLVITVTNANITVNPQSWIEYNETQVKFNIAATSHMESYSSYSVNVYPVGNPQNFTIAYTIEDTTSGLINGLISHMFLEGHGYSPTYAMYVRTSADTYQWLKNATG